MSFSDPDRNISEFGLIEGARIADLGSGSGFYTLAAARKVGGDGKVYAVDIQQNLISRTQEEAHKEGLYNVEGVQGDLEHVGGSKLNDNFVDAVVISNILFQLDNKENVFKEAFRIVRPRGRMLFVEWKDSFGGLGPQPDAIVKEERAREFAEQAGFKIENTITPGAHHYGFIARKG